MVICKTCGGQVRGGGELRLLRRDAGLTQAKFASMCGWSQAYQSYLETGAKVITANNWDAAKQAARKAAR